MLNTFKRTRGPARDTLIILAAIKEAKEQIMSKYTDDAAVEQADFNVLSGKVDQVITALQNMSPAVIADLNAKLAAAGVDAATVDTVITTVDASIKAKTTAVADALAALQPPPAALAIAPSASFPDATVGSSYTSSVSATGGTPPYTITVSGLPDALTFDGTSAISGTVSAAGVSNVNISVTDSASPPSSASASPTLTAA